jgi:short-subunit dehydrogenase
MRLEGKIALITGAGSGIGRALAIEGSRRGLRLALAGRRAAALEATARACVEAGDCLIIPGDLTDGRVRRVARDRLAARWGRLDLLVNNAGRVAAGPLVALRDRELERLVAINLVAPVALTRDLLPLLRHGAPSRVVNIGALLGEVGFPLFAAFSASKSGLRGFSTALRRELGSLGIGVTHVAPRATLTDAARAAEPVLEPLGLALDRPEAVAARVWRGVERDADTVYPPGRERLLAMIGRLMPRLADRMLAAQLEASGIRGVIAEATARPEPAMVPRSDLAVGE